MKKYASPNLLLIYILFYQMRKKTPSAVAARQQVAEGNFRIKIISYPLPPAVVTSTATHISFWTDEKYSNQQQVWVANKFSDTLNELFVVNCLISKLFCENTRWTLVSSTHYLKNLIKSTKDGLSYSLKPDLRPISEITFVSPFDTEPWEFFLQKKCYFLFKSSLSW